LLIHNFYEGEIPDTISQALTNSDYLSQTTTETDTSNKQQSKLKNGGLIQEAKIKNSNSFPDFIKKCKDAKSSAKKNLLIIYYHELVRRNGPIKDEKIKAKYTEMGWKTNKKFRQSLRDVKNKNNWIYEVDEDGAEHESGGWLTTHQGSDYVKENLLITNNG